MRLLGNLAAYYMLHMLLFVCNFLALNDLLDIRDVNQVLIENLLSPDQISFCFKLAC